MPNKRAAAKFTVGLQIRLGSTIKLQPTILLGFALMPGHVKL